MVALQGSVPVLESPLLHVSGNDHCVCIIWSVLFLDESSVTMSPDTQNDSVIITSCY